VYTCATERESVEAGDGGKAGGEAELTAGAGSGMTGALGVATGRSVGGSGMSANMECGCGSRCLPRKLSVRCAVSTAT
jgi:hypothetical protein